MAADGRGSRQGASLAYGVGSVTWARNLSMNTDLKSMSNRIEVRVDGESSKW